ncbi:glycerol kinase GlpK [Weissella halotolerans]|uniref:Glycerol kinase n=1 Tax=Weissella halotolerans DSM 20190 TaxID=1123500 RepID=A0A0R2FVN8_9LACO|nr:glycerol kinase GlpK [Weissella halotolerans]KRN31707.1 glycerol kinase [Weissella halotolerans DSM 20190]
MAEQYILALDQGTTSTRAILFNHAGQQVASAQKELAVTYRQSGWVEQDANQIWDYARQVMAEVIIKTNLPPYRIAGIGITNQRETTIIWDRLTGEPIAPAIGWQSKQTSQVAEELKQAGLTDWIYQKTGLWTDAYFSATKIMWLLDHVPGARKRAEAGDLLFGTIDTWLLYKLTNGEVHATDYTNASRTMLFNIHKGEWDSELLERFNIPQAMLPEVKNSSDDFGYTADYAFFGIRVPITGIAGDQQAALFGHQAFQAGEVKNTYGTGSFIMMNTGDQAAHSQHGLLTTIAYALDGHLTYALEGSVFIAGAAIQWLKDGLGLIQNAKETANLAEKSRLEHPEAIYLVPAFTGLGAPYWDQDARGAMFGLTRGTNRADIVRATVEALAYQTSDVLTAMESDTGMAVKTIMIDGGAAANTYLQQFQADLIQRPVQRPQNLETTALGAAFLAGLRVGFWAQLSDLPQHGRLSVCQPNRDQQALMVNQLQGWHQAVAATRTFPLQM